MATISEMRALRAAKLGTPAVAQPELGKPPARELIVKREPEKNPLQESFPPAWLEKRSLSMVEGEAIPMTPANATAEEATWHEVLQSYETDLCLMRQPDDHETVWLTLKHADNPRLPPILLHRLPWLLYEAPMKPTDNNPF